MKWPGEAKILRYRVEELAAENARLRSCLSVVAPPEGGPMVAVPVKELNEIRQMNEFLLNALRDIGSRPTRVLNPDGVDQAAAEMQMVALDSVSYIMGEDWRR